MSEAVPDRLRTVLHVPGMDCGAEEALAQGALRALPAVADVVADLGARTLTVVHEGPPDALVQALRTLGARAVSSEPCAQVALETRAAHARAEARTLWLVLAINAAMFVVEAVAAWFGESTGLLADAFDMGADAFVYGIALYAVGGDLRAQHRAALWSGILQLGLALAGYAAVTHKLWVGHAPEPFTMAGVSALALAANATCTVLLLQHRGGAVHMRASLIFTTSDVLANLGVIVAGGLVALTASRWPDLVAGAAIATLILWAALRILRLARGPRT